MPYIPNIVPGTEGSIVPTTPVLKSIGDVMAQPDPLGTVADQPETAPAIVDMQITPDVSLAPESLSVDLSNLQQPEAPSTIPLVGENPWDMADREFDAMKAEVDQRNTETYKSMVRNPEKFFEGKNLGFAPDRQTAMKQIITDSYMRMRNGWQPLPPGDFNRQLMRAELAHSDFEGIGADSDDAFHGAIVAKVKDEDDQVALFIDLNKEASTKEFQRREDLPSPADLGNGYVQWRQNKYRDPGYKSEKEPEYYARWNEVQSTINQQIHQFRPQLDSVFSGIVRNDNVGIAAQNAYLELPSDQRKAFLSALSIRAKSLSPEQQAALWGNIRKQTGRDVGGLVRSLGNGLDMFTANTAAANAMDNASIVSQSKMERELIDFAEDVRQVQQSDYDPIKYLSDNSDDVFSMRTLEKGVYGAPGAIASSLMAAVPGVGMTAFYLSSQESVYQEYRQKFQTTGMSYEDAAEKANTLAPIAALPQVIMEKFQLEAFAGRLPFFERAMTSIANKITSKTGQFTVRTIAGAAEEGFLEQMQNIVPDAVQDIAHGLSMDVPDVVWSNGKNGVLDGFWANSASMMVTMLPLAVFGAGSGVISDQARLDAFRTASDSELEALGHSPEMVKEIRTSMAKGDRSGIASIDASYNSLTFDPKSETAKAATEKLIDGKIQEAIKTAMIAGAIPGFRQEESGNTWTIYDQRSGETLATGQSAKGAIAFGETHIIAMQEAKAQVIANLADHMEGSEFAAERNDENRQSLQDITPFDIKEAGGGNLTADELHEVADQTEAMEVMNGGDGAVARMIFGQSKTDRTKLAKGLRQTTNRLFADASILTVFHEDAHGWRKEAYANGIMTREKEIAMYRALDQVMAMRKTKDGHSLRLLPADESKITDKLLSETFSEIMEAEVIRTRKGAGVRKLPPGMISRNLSMLAKINPKAASNLKAFVEAIRAFFGMAVSRAYALKKGIADGSINKAEYENFLSQMLGLSEQAELESQAYEFAQDIVGADYVMEDGDPFSLGKSRPINNNNNDNETSGHIQGAGIPSQSEGGGAERSPSSFVREIAGATEGSADPFASGAESDIYRFGTDRVLKLVQPRGFWTYTEDGKLTRSKDPQLLADKARVISALGGMETTVGATGDSLFLIQQIGSPITETEFQNLELPFNIKPAAGYTYRIEVDGQHFMLSDLHRENFLKDADGNIRVIDLVTGRVNADASPLADISDSEFSIGNAGLSRALHDDAISRIQNPIYRVQAMAKVARLMEDARLQAERLDLLAGTKRMKKSLAREAATREALRVEELENQAYARHWGILSDDDLVRIKSQPLHALFADPSSHLRGRLVSKSAAIKRHPDLFKIHRPGDYDGSDGVSRSVFGGELMPDQAAQEAYEANLIKSPTPDALWDGLRKEQASVAGMKELVAKAQEDIRSARRQAREETNAWLAAQNAEQGVTAVLSTKQEIVQALSLLDGILMALPPALRGQIGGYTQLARIGTNDARLKYLKAKLARADKVLEGWLREQYDREFKELLKRTHPDKAAAGEKPRGKVGADLHQIFASVEAAMMMPMHEVEADAVALESLVASDAEAITNDQRDNATLQANLLRLAGDWGKADAARREAAVLEAQRIFERGYYEFKFLQSAKREKRHLFGLGLKSGLEKEGSRPERKEKAYQDATTIGAMKKAVYGLYSYEQVVHAVFGQDSKEALAIADWERHASYAYTDAVGDKMDQLDALFENLAGGDKLKAEQMRYDMAQDSIDIDGETFTQLEAITATLMWRQEDGQRHMQGHQDDSGAYTGKWHYDQAFMDKLEKQLTPEAKMLRLHLMEQYAAEYDRLNSIYRELYGVALPKHKFYSPLTVKPQTAAAGQLTDPVSGFAIAGGNGLTPGSLRSRSQSAIAEPEFRDALQTYIAHAKQMEHWMAYAPFATEAMALINNRDLGNSVEASSGKEALMVLRSWNDYFAAGGIRDASAQIALNKGISKLTSRAAQMAIVGRASVLAVQSVQLGAALAEMPAMDYLTRFAKLTTGNLDWSGALQSDYIKRRLREMPPVVRQAMEGLSSTSPTKLKYLVRKIGETVSGADALFTAGTYAMIYDYQLAQAKGLGLSGQQATDYAHNAAERSTDRVAQPVRPGARSFLEVSTASNAYSRILWSFASEARQKVALSAYAIAHRSPAEAARALAVTWIVGGVFTTLIRSVIRDIKSDDDNELFDNKNWDPKRLALSALTGPLGGIPVLGDELEKLFAKAFGVYMPDSGMLSAASNAVPAVLNVPGWFTGKRDMAGALKDAEAILTGAGMFNDEAAAAASLSHIARDIFGVIDNVTGD